MAITLPTPEGYTLMRFFSKRQFQRYLDTHRIPYHDIAITHRDVTVVLPCSAYDIARRYGARPAAGFGPEGRIIPLRERLAAPPVTSTPEAA